MQTIFALPLFLRDEASTRWESGDTPEQVQRPGGKACQHLGEEVAGDGPDDLLLP